MTEQSITQNRLKELLICDVDKGLFTWKPRNQKGFKMSGKPAGNFSVEGYYVLKIDKRLYKVHRLVWLYAYGEFPKGEIDHIDHDRGNNGLANLRDTLHGDNARNQSMRNTNTSGHMGVGWRETNQKWQARINAGGKRISLGLFATREAAIVARKAAEILYGYHTNHGVDVKAGKV